MYENQRKTEMAMRVIEKRKRSKQREDNVLEEEVRGRGEGEDGREEDKRSSRGGSAGVAQAGPFGRGELSANLQKGAGRALSRVIQLY